MTSFANSLNVKKWQSDTTVASIDVSGSATFAQGANFGGPVVIAGGATNGLTSQGPITVSASAQFDGAIKQGPGGLGSVVVAQSTTVLSSASGPSGFGSTNVIRLPARAQITDITLLVITSASANVGGMLVRVGTSADEAQFANILCSGQGKKYSMGEAGNVIVSGANWLSVGAAATQIHIDVTAQTSTTQTDKFGAVLTISYMPR